MTCKEIVEMYEEGGVSLNETLYLATNALASGDVETILRSLSLIWRKELELHIFATYDNDIAPDDFIYLGRDEQDLAFRRKKIAVLRDWIAQRKASQPFVRDPQ